MTQGEIRAVIGTWLRRLADRIDHAGAPKITGWSFTFEDRKGIVFHNDLRGCPVAYLGDYDYERAHRPLWDDREPSLS